MALQHTKNQQVAPTLRRELKARHLTMIAIGGSIGTGLFVASGATVSQAGPGGALLSSQPTGALRTPRLAATGPRRELGSARRVPRGDAHRDAARRVLAHPR